MPQTVRTSTDSFRSGVRKSPPEHESWSWPDEQVADPNVVAPKIIKAIARTA
jgi:hypothetical protein